VRVIGDAMNGWKKGIFHGGVRTPQRGVLFATVGRGRDYPNAVGGPDGFRAVVAPHAGGRAARCGVDGQAQREWPTVVSPLFLAVLAPRRVCCAALRIQSNLDLGAGHCAVRPRTFI
jgi:hypothetical protein